MNKSTSFSWTLFNVGWRYLLRRPWQSILMILGITLGVAVVVAIDLANASASRAFELSTDAVAGRATHQITGGPQGLDESLYTELRLAGVPVAMAPVLSAYVVSPQLGGLPMQLLGVDPFAEAPFRDYLGPRTSGQSGGLTDFFTVPGAVLLSADLAERFGLQACGPDLRSVPSSEWNPNCQLTLELSGALQQVPIVALLEPADALSRRALSGLILADISTVQELTGDLGRLSNIDLIIPKGDNAAVTAIEKLLPSDARLQEVAARAGSVAQMTSAFRLNLTALSLLALVVGLFLIYNTMTFSVVQRRPVFGTLRCLGVTRREIFVLVVGEALVVGLLGAGFGILLGILLGQGAIQMVTQTINDLFFVLTVRGVDVPVASLLKGAFLGVFATVLTAAFPAWEAASVPPRAALSRSGLETKARKAVYLVAGFGVALIGAGVAALILRNSGLGISFAGTFAVIIGFAMLTPITTILFMRGATPVSGKLWGALGRMAPRDVVNTMSRTSIAVAALMVSVSVTIGVSLMVSSFRYTVEVWLEQTLQGDVYISPPAISATRATNTILPEVLDKLSNWPGLLKVDTLRSVQVDSPEGLIQIAATDNTDASADRLFVAADRPPEAIWASLEAGSVIISEPLANRLEIPKQGGVIALYTDQGLQNFDIVGIYYDYASTQGTVLMALPVYQSYWGDDTLTAAALRLADGVDPDRVVQELQAALTPLQPLSIRANQALRQEALDVFDRTFAITSALQLLATVVAFIGVLSALLSLQLEKQRELGVMRAVGLTVRQLRGLVILQTGLMGTVAGLLAMPTGYVLALILVNIINRRAFGWTLQMQLAPEPFVQAMLVAVLAAVLAGLYPAVKMGRMVTAAALRGD